MDPMQERRIICQILVKIYNAIQQGKDYNTLRNMFLRHFNENYQNIEKEAEDVFDTFMVAKYNMDYRKFIMQTREDVLDDFLDELADDVHESNTLEPYPLY